MMTFDDGFSSGLEIIIENHNEKPSSKVIIKNHH
jgi:hypothetical protein